MLVFHQVLFALLAFSSTTIAAPATKEPLEISITKKRDAFLLPNSQVINFTTVTQHLDHLKDKYATSLKSYKANTGKAHPLSSTVAPVKKRATGTVALIDVNQSLWHGAITLGSQTSQCDFDTGSADIIIEPGSYTPGATSTNTGKTFTISYGDGTTASGNVYTDTVVVGGLTAKNVSIGRSNSNFLSASEGDTGICGMSYPSISALGAGSTPFFDGLINSGAVTSKVFTFTLSTGTSQLYLGGVDPKAGTPTYTATNPSQGYWVATSSSINGASTSSIVDTGTTLIVAPTAYAQTFFKAVKATTFTQNGVLYGAYTCSSPPTVTYKFGSFSVALSASTVTFGKTTNGLCVLSVVGENIGLNAVIAGDAFLQNVHAVFDRANNRVGFSKQ